MRALLRHRALIQGLCLFLSASCCSMGCRTASPVLFSESDVHYVFTMIHPSTSGDLFHRDERVMAQFLFDQGACLFRFQNISAHPLQFIWNKATLSLDNTTHAVRTYSTYYAADPEPQVLTLPPLGHVTDLLIPVDHVLYDDGTWMELPLFDERSGQGGEYLGVGGTAVEHRISLTIPLLDNGEEIIYRFDFVSVGREPVVEDLPRGRPPIPSSRTASAYDQYLTAGIVLGFGVLLVIIFQTDKSSPIPE